MPFSSVMEHEGGLVGGICGWVGYLVGNLYLLDKGPESGDLHKKSDFGCKNNSLALEDNNREVYQNCGSGWQICAFRWIGWCSEINQDLKNKAGHVQSHNSRHSQASNILF